MLTLTRNEIRNLSQIVISPGLRHAPNVFAFTKKNKKNRRVTTQYIN